MFLLVLSPEFVLAQSSKEQRYKISVCDWMILKRQKIGEFQLAREIGCDGIEVDMGGLGKRDTFDNKLRYPHFQKLFREKAQEFDVEISSIAMSGFYGQSFVERDNYVDLVQDCLNTMEAMGVKIAFLPLGVCNLTKNPELRPELVKRLNPDIGYKRLVNLVTAWNHEIQEMMGGMGINSIEALRGNRLMLRGIGLTDTELNLLGIKYAGESM